MPHNVAKSAYLTRAIRSPLHRGPPLRPPRFVHSFGSGIEKRSVLSLQHPPRKRHCSSIRPFTMLEPARTTTHAAFWKPFQPRSPLQVRPYAATQRPAKRSIAERIPKGSWDSHMHIIDAEQYAFSPDAVYRPKSHRLDTAVAFESSIGIRNIVLVQPSIYGYDNSCLLDGLRQLGPGRARGVVQFDPERTSLAQLQEWHGLGVRGVRLNIQSTGRSVNIQEIEKKMCSCADAIRSLGWVVQIYVPMDLIEALEPIIPTLNIRCCIDHLGHPTLPDHSPDPYDLPGFSSLVRLLKNGQAYVKLSAPYRLTRDNNELEPLAREVLRIGGRTRVIFATDWPHTRFEGLDIRPWIETVLDWCGNDGVLRERLFRGNAEELWDVTNDD